MNLNKDGLEAARDAFEEVAGTITSELALRRAITAYLAALPAPDGLAGRLLREAKAFDSDNGSDPEADAGTAKLLREAATVIQTIQSQLSHFGQLASDHRDELETRAEAAEQQVRDMKEGQREAFMLWVRAWAKKRFGVWITHNTAKGAFAEYQESARLLLKEGGE